MIRASVGRLPKVGSILLKSTSDTTVLALTLPNCSVSCSTRDSVAFTYQAGADDDNLPDIASDGASSDFVEVGRKELFEQKEKFQSIIFKNHPVDAEKLKAYLQDLFKSEEGAKALEKLRKEIKSFSKYLQRAVITTDDVKNAIKGLLTDGLMNEGKRTTLNAFQENPTVLNEVTSVLYMRMASLDSWSWPKEGLVVEFRRHLNGKYRWVYLLVPKLRT